MSHDQLVAQYPKVGLDWTALHEQFRQLVQCLYKGTCYTIPCVHTSSLFAVSANATTSPLVTAGCMFLIRVLRGGVVPPLVSPLTTRAGRKRKRDKCEEGEESPGHGRLDVTLVTGLLADALHDFITVKWVWSALDVVCHVIMCGVVFRNSNVPPSFFTTYIQRYPVSPREGREGLMPSCVCRGWQPSSSLP